MPVPDSAVRARFLSERRVLIPGVYRPMRYLSERVARQHSSKVLMVHFVPPETMMPSTSGAGEAYRKALYREGMKSLCFP